MSIWLSVWGLQAILSIAIVLLARLILKLRWWQIFIGWVFMLPAPVLQIAGGTGSWVFAADLVAPFLAIYVLRNNLPSEDPFHRRVIIAAAILALLPLVSTLVGIMVSPSDRTWKHIVVQCFRSGAYVFVFAFFVRIARLIGRPDNFLLMQCTMFAGLCACGLLQHYADIDLDLWNYAAGADPGEWTGGYGGGFMGLYRGAVGAWGACVLGAYTVILLPRNGSFLILPLALAVVGGGILVTGSRQGVLIGAMGVLIGLWHGIGSVPVGRRPALLSQAAVFLFLTVLLGLYLSARLENTELNQWISRRFDQIGELRSLGDAIDLALSRDPRYGRAVDNVFSSVLMLCLGAGYGTETAANAVGIGYFRIYVDSELFYTWQAGGVLTLTAYLVFLCVYRVSVWGHRQPIEVHTRTAVRAVIPVFWAGILMLWGHFFLLNSFAHHAPVGYWQWAILGLAAGLCSSPNGAARSNIAA
jgi:hypothetical protein